MIGGVTDERVERPELVGTLSTPLPENCDRWSAGTSFQVAYGWNAPQYRAKRMLCTPLEAISLICCVERPVGYGRRHERGPATTPTKLPGTLDASAAIGRAMPPTARGDKQADEDVQTAPEHRASVRTRDRDALRQVATRRHRCGRRPGRGGGPDRAREGPTSGGRTAPRRRWMNPEPVPDIRRVSSA